MNFKHKRYLFSFIAILIIMMIENPTSISAKQSNSSVLLDLNDNIDSKEFYTNLDGEWDFFDKELLTPDEVKEQLRNEQWDLVSLPDSFEAQTGEVNSFGTYSTRIKIPEKFVGETLAIYIPFQYSAYTFYIDEIEIAKNGEVGKDLSSHHSEMAPETGYFIAESDEVLLTMQVSSFDHIRGGFENSIYIGEASVVSQKFNMNMLTTLFMNGGIFVIGLFMVLFAWYRYRSRKELVFFLFGIFAMLISARSLFTVPFYYKLLFIDMSWLWGTRLEYILTEATSMFFVVLLWKWHEDELI